MRGNPFPFKMGGGFFRASAQNDIKANYRSVIVQCSAEQIIKPQSTPATFAPECFFNSPTLKIYHTNKPDLRLKPWLLY